MDIRAFCHNIGLDEKAVEAISSMDPGEERYREMRGRYWTNRQEFYGNILGNEQAQLWFLYYYCRFACETHEEYRLNGITEDVFWDTFLDIRLWCENCYRETGFYGILEYDWFWRHFERKLFRLGRLQFETMEIGHEICGKGILISQSEPVISIHIPQGEPLDWEECERSFQKAFQWFGMEKKYICHSWLLSPGLREVLPADSNILRFQSRFQVIKIDYKEREAEKRIFGCVLQQVEQYSEDTTLQRRAKEYLLSGKSIGNGWGVLRFSK